MGIGLPSWFKLKNEVEMQPYHSHMDDEEDEGPDIDDVLEEADPVLNRPWASQFSPSSELDRRKMARSSSGISLHRLNGLTSFGSSGSGGGASSIRKCSFPSFPITFTKFPSSSLALRRFFFGAATSTNPGSPHHAPPGEGPDPAFGFCYRGVESLASSRPQPPTRWGHPRCLPIHPETRLPSCLRGKGV